VQSEDQNFNAHLVSFQKAFSRCEPNSFIFGFHWC